MVFLREIAAEAVTGAGVQLKFHSARDNLNLNSKDKGLDLTDTELWDSVAPTNSMPVSMCRVFSVKSKYVHPGPW